MEKPRAENIEKNGENYLQAAQDRLKEAKLLLEGGSYGGSVSRSYYAFLDAATAALLTKNTIPRSHAGVIDLFSLYFIKKGPIDTKFIRWFKRIKKDREDADYKHEKAFTQDDASETLQEAEEFVGVIKKLFPKLIERFNVK